MNAAPLYLARHAFYCLTQDHCVFLDLRNDKYLCTAREMMLTIGPLLYEFDRRLSSGNGAPDGASQEILSFSQELLRLGLLTSDPSTSRPAVATEVYPPTRVLSTLPLDPSSSPSLIDFLKFVKACASAHLALTRHKLEDTVRAVVERKRSGLAHAHRADTCELQRLVSEFQKLRYIFPRQYLCLFDSLALINYLDLFRVYPDWVFGVRSDPFAAHCWVESEGFVVNDILDEANGFTRIMIV